MKFSRDPMSAAHVGQGWIGLCDGLLPDGHVGVVRQFPDLHRQCPFWDGVRLLDRHVLACHLDAETDRVGTFGKFGHVPVGVLDVPPRRDRCQCDGCVDVGPGGRGLLLALHLALRPMPYVQEER